MLGYFFFIKTLYISHYLKILQIYFLEVIGNMPLIITIPTWQKAQSHITGRALHWCLYMAVSAPQTTCGAVSTDMHRLVMCSVWSGRWSRPVSSRCCCQLINKCLPECPLVHGYLSFTFCDILVKQEGIHNGNVHEVIKKCLIPLLGLVDDFIVTDQGIREVHSTHAPVWTEKTTTLSHKFYLNSRKNC